MSRSAKPSGLSFPIWALPFVGAMFATRRFSVVIAPLVVFAVLVTVDALATRAISRTARLRVIGPVADEPTVAIGQPIELAPVFQLLDGRVDPEVDALPLHVPTRSGVITGVAVDVRVTLMGLVDRTRSVDAQLERPLFVAPDVIPPETMFDSTPADLTTSRRYEWGDRPSRINWAATARTGDLMVRSVGSEPDTMTIIVDLSLLDGLDDSTDARARDDYLGRSAGLAIEGLESGREVFLVTNELSQQEIVALTAGAELAPEAGRTVERAVVDRADVLLRLARSVPGRPIESTGEAIRVSIGSAT